MPVNRRLAALSPAEASGRCRALVRQWGALHAVRTGLGAAAVACFLFAGTA